MFAFFRKYQYYFFVVISVVIITSFSFFGTYSALSSNHWKEQIAFTAIDGSEITRADVDEMAVFLATDTEDKLALGGIWGPNFLNDGVIRKNFLETGIAPVLAETYIADLEADLLRKLDKEKHYSLYTHPQAKFIGTAKAWEYFAPDMQNRFQALRNATTAQEAINAKVKLYLAEKSFPPGLLRQVIRFQEKQNSWLQPDQNLDRLDLSLFGYHTAEDWFGPHFTRLVSQFIINTAIIAEQKGYNVSKAEVLADLQHNANLSYEQNRNQSNIGVRNAAEYMNEQLLRLNMDQSRAVKVWRQVMLFRRYFDDIGGSALADVLPSKTFNQFTKEGLEIDVYRLPSDLKFGDYGSLQKFEIYVNAVGKSHKGTQEIPQNFLTAAELEKDYPELVQKRYLVEVSEIEKKSLQPKISIKDMWNWEVQDANWPALKKKFVDLGVKKGDTREERFEALDSLDSVTRSHLDAFARESIVESHPEWIQKALDESSPTKKVIGMRTSGGKTPFAGLDKRAKRKELIEALDKAALNEAPESGSPLFAYTADNQHYYRIKIIEKASQPDVLTFAESNGDGTLDQIKDRILKKHYEATREQNALLYQHSDKSWKEFDKVRDLVADSYFEKAVADLQKEYKKVNKEDDSKTVGKDRAASIRLYSHLKQAQDKIKKDPKLAEQLIRHKKASDLKPTSLNGRDALADQWKLENDKLHIDRTNIREGIDVEEAYGLPILGWSGIKTPANGDLIFYQVKGRELSKSAETAMAEQTKKVHDQLSYEAQRLLTSELIQQIQAKDAISLTYLLQPAETLPASVPQMEL